MHMCKMIISPGVFFFYLLQFWFSRSSGGWKCKTWPKITKNLVCCTLYFWNHISYDLHLWYTYIYKRIISPVIFFHFFQILIFGIMGIWKGKKWPKITKHFVCLTSYLRNHISYDYDLWYTCVKWWYLQHFFSFFQNFDFWVFMAGALGGGWKGKNDLTLPISVCFALYLSNCRSYHWDFDNDISSC